MDINVFLRILKKVATTGGLSDELSNEEIILGFREIYEAILLKIQLDRLRAEWQENEAIIKAHQTKTFPREYYHAYDNRKALERKAVRLILRQRDK